MRMEYRHNPRRLRLQLHNHDPAEDAQKDEAIAEAIAFAF
jgi:hypothetical protein